MESFVKILENFKITRYVLGAIGIAVLVFVLPKNLSDASSIINLGIKTAPFWLPVVLIPLFWKVWRRYVWIYNQSQISYTLLEIRLPAEVTQSPLAMELVLNVLYQTGIDTPFHDYWKGDTEPWFSLEIASLEGKVHFYIWMRAKFKDIVEAQLYAHYPDCEVNEVPDYVPAVRFDDRTMEIWGIEQKKQRADPLPIKTYIDYGLDKEKKEEFKSDPLLSLVEFFGSFGKGEYAYHQIVIRAHNKGAYPVPGKWFKKMLWDEAAKLEIDKILSKTKDKDGNLHAERLTGGDKDILESMERNILKKAFDVGIRTFYLAKKEDFKKTRRAGFPTAFRSFEHSSSNVKVGYNGFKPIFIPGFAYPWEDPFGNRTRAVKEELYDSYRWRSFFFPPYRRHFVVLSSEEIATIYHFPGAVAHTPTLERIPSRRSEAPANLPL